MKIISGIILILAICLMPGSLRPASAAGRLSVSSSKLWLNGEGKLIVTLENRSDGESVTVTPKKTGYVKISEGTWDGDRCTFILKPLKSKNTYLTITSGSESIRVKLVMLKEKTMSGTEIYSYAKPAMVEIRATDSEGSVYVGSGFFIGKGLVITNQHVVAAASKIEILDYSGKSYRIKEIYGCDETRDLMVFKVSGDNTSALVFSDTVTGGEKTYFIGSPAALTGTFTTGVVGNEGYFIDGVKYNQLSMPTGVGMGGGPILNSKGKVIGIMTLYVNSAQNIAIAVDHSEITAFLDEINAGSRQSLEDFYESTKGKTKESNDYQIFDGFSDESCIPASDDTYPRLTPEEIYRLGKKACVDIIITYDKEGSASAGSGFFIDDNTVITNYHVIEATRLYSITITDYYGNLYSMNSAMKRPEYDVAVIDVSLKKAAQDEVTGKTTRHGVLDIARGYIPAVGEEVYAMGSPAGYSCTFSTGTVSMSERYTDDLYFIAHTAPITQGSSGGPLFNAFGQVIGINSRIIPLISNLNLSILIDYIDKVA